MSEMTKGFPHDELTALAHTAFNLLRDTPGLAEQLEPHLVLLLLQAEDGRFALSSSQQSEDMMKIVQTLVNGLRSICRVEPMMTLHVLEAFRLAMLKHTLEMGDMINAEIKRDR